MRAQQSVILNFLLFLKNELPNVFHDVTGDIAMAHPNTAAGSFARVYTDKKPP